MMQSRPFRLFAFGRQKQRCLPSTHSTQYRKFSSEVLLHPVTSLSQAYLNLGASFQLIPLPEFLPPHAAAVIAATILLRTSVTLPLAIWSRARVRRFKDGVIPLVKEAETQYAREFKEQNRMRRIKITESMYEDFKNEYGPKLAAYRKQLIEKYRCAPLPTLIVPVVIHLPVFIMSSLALREASLPPTPLLYEVFFSETSLAQTDAFGFFPLAIGITSLVNFEVSRRFFAPVRDSQSKWGSIIDNAIRGASVIIVAAGMMAPNSVTLYWLTSNLYTFGQTIALGILDRRPTPVAKLSTQEGDKTVSSLNTAKDGSRHAS